MPTSAPEVLPATAPVSPFRDRRFVLLWLGQLVSSLGDAALLIAIPLTIYHATHSKLNLSAWAIAEALPVMLLGLFAGAFVDRWNRRRTMIVADLGRAGVVLLPLCVPGAHVIGMLYVVAFLTSAFTCFFSPARTALMAAVLPRQRLMQANAATTSGMQIVQFVGPSLAGALLGWLHPRGVFVFDAVTFLVSALCIALVSAPPSAKPPRLFSGVWRDALAGLRYVRESRTLVSLIVLLLLVLLGAGIYNTLEVAFATDIWHTSVRQFGYLMSAFGLGAIAGGALVAGPLRDLPPPRLIAAAFGVMFVGSVAFAAAPNLYAGGAALFVLGLGNMLVNIPVLTLFQSSSAQEMLGRVTATSTLVMRASLFLAAALAGLLATVFALRPIFAALSLAYLLCAVLTLPLLEPKDAEAPASDVPLNTLDT